MWLKTSVSLFFLFCSFTSTLALPPPHRIIPSPDAQALKRTTPSSPSPNRSLSITLPSSSPFTLPSSPSPPTPPRTLALATKPASTPKPRCYPSTLDRHSTPLHPPILSLPDCARAAHELLSNRYEPATEPRAWNPVRREWTYRSCAIFLMPNQMFSVDYFSRGAIAAVALQVKSACVNQANGWRGGEMGIGGNGAFEVGILGVKERRPGGGEG